MDASLDNTTLLSFLNGVETARKVAVACFTLNIWDIVTTFDEEVCLNLLSLPLTVIDRFQTAFFWKGDWTVSRGLFLFVSVSALPQMPRVSSYEIIESLSASNRNHVSTELKYDYHRLRSRKGWRCTVSLQQQQALVNRKPFDAP